MSEEFSGHTIRSGRCAWPDLIRLASAWVAATWLSSTTRRSANASSPSPGTLPCTAATVTRRLCGDVACQGQTAAAQASTAAAASPATARSGVRRTQSRVHASVVPEQCHQERDAGERRRRRTPVPRACPRRRRPAGPTGSRRTGRRPAAPPGGPRSSRPDRPPRQAYDASCDGRGGQPGDAVEQRLDQGQGDPRVGPDDAHPRQQHEHERRPEHEPEPEAGAQPPTDAQQRQPRHRQGQQPGPVDRLEREGRSEAGRR